MDKTLAVLKHSKKQVYKNDNGVQSLQGAMWLCLQ